MGLAVEHRSTHAWRPALRGGARLLLLVLGCSASGWSSAQAVEPALRLPLSRRAQLVVQTRPWQPVDALTAQTLPATAQQPSLGLEFKAKRPTDGALSLLRVQLSGESVLQFRPRGGGLAVSYRSQF